MNHLAPALFAKILEATLSASILAVIVFLVQLALRKRLSAAWRFALWIPVLIRLLIPVLPETSFSIFNAPRWLRSVFPTTPQLTVEIKENAAVSTTVQPVSHLDLTVADNSLLVVPIEKPALNTFQKVTLLWLSVSVALLLRLVLGAIWLNLRLRKHRILPSPFLLRAFLAACDETRTRWKPHLIETILVDSPGLFGLIRPKLLLPFGIDSQLTETELRHIFLHELAHLKRSDLLTNWFMSIAHAIHWFNPIVWFLLRRMRLERELACDALALQSAGPEGTRAYGETILKLLERVKRSMPLPAMVGILEETQTAKSRLKQIAIFKSQPRLTKLGFPLLLATVLFGLSNGQSKSPSSPQPELKPEVSFARPADSDPPSAQTIAALQEEWTKQKKIVAEAQSKVDQLRSSFGFTDVPNPAGPDKCCGSDDDKSPREAEAQYIHLKTLAQEYRGKTKEELRKIIPVTYPNPKLDRLLDELHKAEQQLAAVLLDYTHDHPAVRRIMEIIKTIETQIDDEIDGTLVGLETKVAQAKVLSEKFKEAREQAKKEDAEKRAQYAPYFAAKRDLENQQRILNTIFIRILAERVDAKLSENKSVNPKNTTAAVLVNDARLLMEMGKLDEAELKLKAALANNPDLRAAQYYLTQINQRRKAMNARTNRVIFPVIKTDMAETTRDSAELPEKPAPLYTRTFKVDSANFLENLERLQGSKSAKDTDPTTATNRIQILVRSYFESKGVDFRTNAVAHADGQPVTAPQKAIFFNDRTGILFVRATLAELDKVETALQKLNTKSHEVEFYCRLISLPPEAGAEFIKDFIKQPFNQPGYSPNAVGWVRSVMNDDRLKQTVEAMKKGSNTISISNHTVTITGLLSDPQFSNVVASFGGPTNALGKAAEAPDAANVFKTESDLMDAAEKIKGSQVLGGVSLLAFTGQTAVIKVAAGPKMEVSDTYDPEKLQHYLRADVAIPQNPKEIAFTTYAIAGQGETYVFAKNAKLPQHKGVPILSDIPALGPLFENAPTEERTILFFIVPKVR